MSNVDFQGENDQANFVDKSVNSGVLSVLRNNRTIVSVATSAILALSGASASQLAAYSGTTYNGNPGACDTSYQITSLDDPKIETDFGDQTIATSTNSSAIQNFSTVYNTAGGESTVATSPANTAYGAFNMGASMTHLGTSGFNLNFTVRNITAQAQGNTYTYSGGGIQASLTDAQGNQVTIPHTFADGTTVSWPNGGLYAVTQPLNGGGTLTTAYQLKIVPNENLDYLQVYQWATGAALVSGSAIATATGDENPILALPCPRIDPNNAGGVLPTPTPPPPPPTPVPAFDTTGAAAQESM